MNYINETKKIYKRERERQRKAYISISFGAQGKRIEFY